jgi:acyl-CoA synthetase (AMP-forming)/AMP-acid ligase II
MANRIVEDSRERLSERRCVIISGARLERDLARSWQERIGGTAYNYYGSVEAGAIAVSRLDAMAASANPRSLGHAAFGVDLEIHATQSLEGEEWSQIIVRGPGVAIGIESEDEGYRPIDGMNPGDLVRRETDGDLSFGGRADDVIISGGVNVYPGLVEQVFRRMKGLPEVALVGVPSAEWGHELVLAIEAQAASAPSDEDLRAFAARELARYARPKRYLVFPRFPQTAAGKVDRRALARLIAAGEGARA